MLLVDALALSANQFLCKKKSLRVQVCALGENWTREIDFINRHEDNYQATGDAGYVNIYIWKTKPEKVPGWQPVPGPVLYTKMSSACLPESSPIYGTRYWYILRTKYEDHGNIKTLSDQVMQLEEVLLRVANHPSFSPLHVFLSGKFHAKFLQIFGYFLRETIIPL